MQKLVADIKEGNKTLDCFSPFHETFTQKLSLTFDIFFANYVQINVANPTRS